MAKLSKAAEERAAAKKQLDSGALTDREVYTAKQVATRCGTDSKTMRKFFRSSNSTVEPVGQGGRYEFDAKDFPKIKREFDGWQKRIQTRKQEREKTVTIAEVTEMAKKTYLEQEAEDPTCCCGENLSTHPSDHSFVDAERYYSDSSEPTPDELADIAQLEAELELDLGPDPKVVDYED